MTRIIQSSLMKKATMTLKVQPEDGETYIYPALFFGLVVAKKQPAYVLYSHEDVLELIAALKAVENELWERSVKAEEKALLGGKVAPDKRKFIPLMRSMKKPV